MEEKSFINQIRENKKKMNYLHIILLVLNIIIILLIIFLLFIYNISYINQKISKSKVKFNIFF